MVASALPVALAPPANESRYWARRSTDGLKIDVESGLSRYQTKQNNIGSEKGVEHVRGVASKVRDSCSSKQLLIQGTASGTGSLFLLRDPHYATSRRSGYHARLHVRGVKRSSR